MNSSKIIENWNATLLNLFKESFATYYNPTIFKGLVSIECAENTQLKKNIKICRDWDNDSYAINILNGS